MEWEGEGREESDRDDGKWRGRRRGVVRGGEGDGGAEIGRRLEVAAAAAKGCTLVTLRTRKGEEAAVSAAGTVAARGGAEAVAAAEAAVGLLR